MEEEELQTEGREEGGRRHGMPSLVWLACSVKKNILENW